MACHPITQMALVRPGMEKGQTAALNWPPRNCPDMRRPTAVRVQSFHGLAPEGLSSPVYGLVQKRDTAFPLWIPRK